MTTILWTSRCIASSFPWRPSSSNQIACFGNLQFADNVRPAFVDAESYIGAEISKERGGFTNATFRHPLVDVAARNQYAHSGQVGSWPTRPLRADQTSCEDNDRATAAGMTQHVFDN